MTKRNFDHLVKYGAKKPEDDKEYIRVAVDFLIDALYIPVKEDGKVKTLDPERTRLFKIGHEPINWGDLKCMEVEKFDTGEYLITIDEASPGECPSFCNYIYEYMKAYGWNCRIQTEW